MRAAVISISSSRADAVAAGEPGDPDLGGDALAHFASDVLGATLAGRELVPDDRELIASTLARYADTGAAELILTTGGTGCAPSDVTPEATRAVIEREVPGIAEAMRAASVPHTGHWMLSRSVAGIRRASLIVNFPGSPRSIAECGAAIAGALPHAVALITGESGPGASHVAGSSTTSSH